MLQLEQIKKLTTDLFFIGDFNIDLIKYDSSNEISRFLDMLLSYNFLPCTILPTRITDSSSTLIDHIYHRANLKRNSYNNVNCINGIIITDISDHLANCLILPSLTTAKSAPDRPLVRIFSQKNKLHFSN